MPNKIVISTEDFEVEAVLLEEDRPETCEKIWNALPIEEKASLYEDEIYFEIPVDIGPEDATLSTEKGDVSYWPDGNSFCVFFGESQPVSPVNTFAKIEESSEEFRRVESGEKIEVRKG